MKHSLIPFPTYCLVFLWSSELSLSHCARLPLTRSDQYCLVMSVGVREDGDIDSCHHRCGHIATELHELMQMDGQYNVFTHTKHYLSSGSLY